MLHLILLLLGATHSVPSADDWEKAPRILAVVKRWKEGDHIPQALQHFQETTVGCFGSPTDTSQLLSQITNAVLLAALASDPSVDTNTHEAALQRGMYLIGPTAFFAAVRARLAAMPSRDPWIRELSERFSRRHVVVDGLFIRYADMSSGEAITARGRTLVF